MSLAAAHSKLAETRSLPATRNGALLATRLVLCWVFVYHGAATLFGAFGGLGLHRSSLFYGEVAHLHPAMFFAVLGGCIELFGALALGFGVLGRLAGAALTGDMIVAMISVTFANGIDSAKPGGGYELNLALGALSLVVALLGTGSWSLDAVVGSYWRRSHDRALSRAGRG